MAKELAVIKQFTGRMITAGDVSDISKEDAAYIENLVSDFGLLRLNRNHVEIVAGTTISVTHTQGYSCYGWNYPTGNICHLYAYKNGSVYLGGSYGSAIGSLSNLTAKVIQASDTNIAITHNKASYLPYRNVLRIGTDKSYFPSTLIYYDAANSRFGSSDTSVRGLLLYCNAGDGTDYGLRPLEVYTAGVTDASPSRTSGGYSHYGCGFTGISQGTSNVGQFPEGAIIYYGITAVYDNSQESPLTVVKTPITIGAGHTSVKLGIFVGAGAGGEVLLNPRITGFNIYRSTQTLATTSADDFTLVYQIDCKNGLANDDSGNGSLAWALIGTGYYGITGIDDPGFMKIERYSDRTGYTNFNLSEETTFVIDPRVKWDIGAFVNGRAVVNSLSYYRNGSEVAYEKNRLAISRIGKPDVFLPDSYIQLGIREGQGFKSMAAIGDARLVVWTSNHTFVINCEDAESANWFLEAEYPMGLVNGDAWTTYPGGVIFCSNLGIYVVDVKGMITELGKTLTELSMPIRNLWTDSARTSCKPYYHYPTGMLYVIKFATNPTSGLIFNLRESGITYWNNGNGSTDMVAAAHLMYKGYSDVPYLLHFNNSTTITIVKVSSSTGYIDWDYKTPILDFGAAAVEKTCKHVFFRYKSNSAFSAAFYINGSGTATSTETINASSDGKTAHVRFPYRFRTLQVRLYTDLHSGALELNEIGIEYKPRRAR
jgi:hypothetical protein